MGEPHWLLQELAGEAIWTSIALGGAWALRHRHEVANRLRDLPYLISNPGAKGFDEVATLNAVVSRRMRMTYNPFTGRWVTSEIPLE